MVACFIWKYCEAELLRKYHSYSNMHALVVGGCNLPSNMDPHGGQHRQGKSTQNSKEWPAYSNLFYEAATFS